MKWFSTKASLVAQLVKNPPAMKETPVRFLYQENPLEKRWHPTIQPTPVFLGFPGGSVGKESTCNAGDLGSISGLGSSPGGRHGNPLQYSRLENPHGQRSLAGYSLLGARVRHDLATKPQPQPPCSLHTTASSSGEEGEDE